MNSYNENMEEEKAYLKDTVALIQEIIESEKEEFEKRKEQLLATRRDMWENTAHFSKDFERLTEMNQALQQEQVQAIAYDNSKKRIDKYLKMCDSPYFGRFDFTEEDCKDNEKIYIGKGNVTNPQTRDIIVYDWRAPISSMFYRFEPGTVSFKTPSGEIFGEMTLKRQYKIVWKALKYFFDCSIQISDEILQEVLSGNSSPQMRTIIETIQKEQDIIIRDTESDLLIVQGVAGSGKTSIALHRIAYLLYEGLASKLSSNNILILSPSDNFNNYISQVLPELGEENVVKATMEGIVKTCLKGVAETAKLFQFKGRYEQLEECIAGREVIDGERVDGESVLSWLQFKGSKTFKTILDRYLKLYENKLIKFDDVYYANTLVASSHELKYEFLNNRIGMSIADRLSRLENRLVGIISELRKTRLNKLEAIIGKKDEHKLEIKSYARLLRLRDSKKFVHKLKKFTEMDVFALYQDLFKDKDLFYRLAKGLELPVDIDRILEHTIDAIQAKHLNYEDWTAIAYLKLKIYGSKQQHEIMQVVIDEIQDYYPLQLAIIKDIYGDAKFTVVGDISQTMDRKGEFLIYEEMKAVLGKNKAVLLSLNRCYRSSFEISEFSKKIGEDMRGCLSFPRYEEEPEITNNSSMEELDEHIRKNADKYLGDGYERVGILCKTMKQANILYKRLVGKMKVILIDGSEMERDTGCSIMPIYAAKGLEFDAVIIPDVDDANFCNELDRRLLYIACTRALHRLNLCYVGEKSRFLPG